MARIGSQGLDRRGLTVLSLGHVSVDMCQGAVPAMLPFMVAQRGYGYAAASALVLAATVSSSIIQPLFGLASDRRSQAWLMPAGLVVAGVGIAVAGIVHPYPLTFAAIALSGIGVAAYHPEASRYASYTSGERRATGMSLFSVGGNAGFALGPILVTPLILLAGMAGTVGLLAVPLAAALLLAHELARLRGFRPAASGTGARGTEVRVPADRWGAFTRLSLAVACRSIIYFGLLTFVPLYFVAELHTSKGQGNAALSVMLICGALGTLIGGRVADRVGPRRVFVASMALVGPLVVAFLLSGAALATILLGLIGGVTIATFSLSVVIGQALLPRRVGLASGVTLGLSIGIGGLAASALGVLADAHGVRTAIEVVAAVAVPAVALAASLPGTRAAGPGSRRPAADAVASVPGGAA